MSEAIHLLNFRLFKFLEMSSFPWNGATTEAGMPLDIGGFVSEPVGEKSVADVPGISEKQAELLRNAGFSQASEVIGKFFVLRKNRTEFENWLTSILTFEDC